MGVGRASTGVGLTSRGACVAAVLAGVRIWGGEATRGGGGGIARLDGSAAIGSATCVARSKGDYW